MHLGKNFMHTDSNVSSNGTVKLKKKAVTNRNVSTTVQTYNHVKVR